MNIGGAIDSIKNGRYVSRPSWGHRVYLLLDKGADVITYSHNGYDDPWTPAHIDLLANDWEEVIPHR